MRAVYLAGQAALTVVWWTAMAASDRVRGWFELDAATPRVLDAFLLADLAVFALGSAAAAVALHRGALSAPRLVAATAGGAAYATLYLVAWVVAGGHGWAGIPPMVAATVITTAIAARPDPARQTVPRAPNRL